MRDEISEKQWRDEVGRWIQSCGEKDAEIERLRETDRLREAAFNAYAEQEQKDRSEIERLRAEIKNLHEMIGKIDRQHAAERDELLAALSDLVNRWATERGYDGAIQRARKLILHHALQNPTIEDVHAAIAKAEGK